MVVKQKQEFTVVCSGSTGSKTRSSDMFSHWEVVHHGGGQRGALPSTQSFPSEYGSSVVVWMLCCHEILVVEEAEQRGGEQAGGNPPSEEGEKAPEQKGTKNSSQAPEGHRELSYRCTCPRLYHRGCFWSNSLVQLHHRVWVHLVGARQVLFGIHPPGMTTCRWMKQEGKTSKSGSRYFYCSSPGDLPKVFNRNVVCSSITSGATYCSAITHR